MPAIPTLTRRPPAEMPPDLPLSGRQFEVFTSGGIVCVTGGYFSDPGRGTLIQVPRTWTGHDIRTPAWVLALLQTGSSGHVAGVRLVCQPGPETVVPGPQGGVYPLVLARISAQHIFPILAGSPLVFSLPGAVKEFPVCDGSSHVSVKFLVIE